MAVRFAGTMKPEIRSFRIGERPVYLAVLHKNTYTPLLDELALVREINTQNGLNLCLPKASVVHAVVKQGEGWFFGKCGPFATDAVIAYEKPGIPLGKEIVMRCFVALLGVSILKPTIRMQTFSFEGKPVALLVQGVTSRDLVQIEDCEFRLDVAEKRIAALEDFPRHDGVYPQHPDYVVPARPKTGYADGEEVVSLRRENGPYVGLAYIFAGRDSGHLTVSASHYSVVIPQSFVVEIPESEVQRASAIRLTIEYDGSPAMRIKPTGQAAR